MTDSDDSTRPISVAELLAKNGTIGAPVSGRRRRRRGNSDAVTVAELTGEIPIIKVDSYGPLVTEAPAQEHAEEQVTAAPADVEVEEPETTVAEATAVGSDDVTSDEVDAAPTDVDATLVDDAAPVEPLVGKAAKSPVDAEEMSPDPVGDDDVVTDADDADLLALSGAHPVVKLDEHADPGYAELFGGEAEVTDLPEPHQEPDEATGSPVVRGAWVVGQSVLAVAFGAGMFFGFDQLWRWNMIVALVLSVLVILGLVVGVRVVRKTDDLASTLTAVVVGALVTFGPLALLTSH